MKKFYLLAAGSMLALTAQAQYAVDPSTSIVAEQGPKTVSYIVLSNEGIAELEKAGATCTYIGPDADAGRNLWYWDETFIAGDESYPRVDMAEGGYVSLEVGTVGWSGAGFDCQGDGISTLNFNDDTRFHLAYMTPSGNGPASIGLVVINGGEQYPPANIAIGDPFNDNGVIYPAIAPKINDDWQGLDISLGDMKKISPNFKLENTAEWKGNILAVLGGGITGQTMAFDAIYFYNTGESGIEGTIAENAAEFVVTANTINVLNGHGIALYNIGGQKIKATAGTTLGINDLAAGIYVARSGNKTHKLIIK